MTSWRARVAGEDCPLDAPRPDSTGQWDLVARLSVSSLYLATNQTYRGRCQLIFDPRHVARVDELSAGEWASLSADLYTAHRAIVQVVQPDHVNVESLGNVVPHLHWHIIPRCIGDPRWGQPVWLAAHEAEPDTRLSAGDRAALLTALRHALIAQG
jgi:diadenosine tetraphosphate (Ap4A) HIT family hydrolase